MSSVDQLTALEDFSFRRIANGGVKSSLLRADDLRRLLDLGLAMINVDRVALTVAGRARFAESQRTQKPDLSEHAAR